MNLTDFCKEILELDEKATEGPWIADSDGQFIECHEQITHNYSGTNSSDICILQDLEYIIYNDDNAMKQNSALIAHYRTSAPKLARALLFLISELENLRPNGIQETLKEADKILEEK